jgi:outer membrane protein TolC
MGGTQVDHPRRDYPLFAGIQRLWRANASGCFVGHCSRSVIALILLSGTVLSQAAPQTGAVPPSSPQEPPVVLVQPPTQNQTAPPLTITLKDALERAQRNDAAFQATVTDAKSAREDVRQAQAGRLPQFTYRMDYLGTQGNGITPNGRYVTNDGVHVYRDWLVLRQDLSANTFRGTGYNRASAAEALAQARSEIARRGLAVTVTRNFYGLVVAQRKYAIAQQALDQAKHFFDISQALERGGQAAHSDVIRAEIQYEQAQAAFEEARLGMEDTRLTLAVMLFPDFDENFTAVDDLDSGPALPTFGETQAMAERQNPDLRVAMESLRAATFDISAAKASFLPSVTFETDYGIEANAFALHAIQAASPLPGKLPTLGYSVTAALNLPVWDWGTLRSRLRQAEYRQQQAHVELSQVQRRLVSQLYAAYNEALVARSAVDTQRHTADLAADGLRLIDLRYVSGASTALEVVDAQNTLTQARNAFGDAQVRYRVALSTLQTLTGSF